MRRVVIVFLLVVSFVPTASAAALERGDAPLLFGLATSDFRADLPAFEAATGRFPAFLQLFWNIEQGWPVAWAPAMLDELHAMGVTPYVEVNTTGGDEAAYRDFVAGRLDSELVALAEMIGDWLASGPGRRIVIAPFTEPNLPEHPWGADPDGFIASYVKVRSAFVEAGIGPEKIRFAWSVNGGMPTGSTYAAFYPGDELVDIVAFSKLNRDSPWRDFHATMGVYIDEIQDQLTRTKPIFVSQTGSVESGQARDGWIRDMFDGLAREDQVVGAIYFNRDKFEAGRQNDYRIVANSVVDPVIVEQLPAWSPPDDADWIFDGRMDTWVAAREAEIAASGGFADAVDSPFAADIAWLAAQEITSGCAADRFCPDDPVLRGQMAAFLHRALQGSLTPGPPVEFSDDDGSTFESDIEWLAATGVTKGCGESAFCPSSPVTRGEMAAFLVRAFGYTARGGFDFTDDEGSVFEADIERLAAVGVTLGCDPPTNSRFCPGSTVTRGQMAAFLHRALG